MEKLRIEVERNPVVYKACVARQRMVGEVPNECGSRKQTRCEVSQVW